MMIRRGLVLLTGRRLKQGQQASGGENRQENTNKTRLESSEEGSLTAVSTHSLCRGTGAGSAGTSSPGSAARTVLPGSDIVPGTAGRTSWVQSGR